jgi:phenylalanyl-tRNA synthetase beta chain
LVVDGGRTHSEVLAAILSVKEPLLVDATLFDVFTDATGQRLAVGSKSLAYSLVYRSLERTLQAEEVTAAHDRIKKRLQEVVGATFRE